ncbi:hypothetical protein D3C81_816770 [compost metagenome]
MFAEVVGRGVDAGAVGGQGDATGRTVPLRSDLARLAAGQVHRHQAEAIGFEARALHRAVEQGLAVGAEHRASIPGRVGRGQVDRCLLAGGIEAVQVEVGRPRFLLAGHADAGDHAAAIRRPREIVIATERLGRRVAIDGRAQRRSALDRTGLGRRQRGDEQGVATAVVPGIPVAHEQRIEDLAAGLGAFHVLQLLLGARQVRGTGLEHAGAEQHAVVLRRHVVAVHVHREVGQLARGAAADRLCVQLLAAVLGAEEVHGLAIGRQRGGIDVPASRGDLLRRGCIAGAQVAREQGGAGLQVGIGAALGEHHGAAVSGQYRRGDAVHGHHVADFQATGSGDAGQGSQQAQWQQGMTQFHRGLRRTAKNRW